MANKNNASKNRKNYADDPDKFSVNITFCFGLTEKAFVEKGLMATSPKRLYGKFGAEKNSPRKNLEHPRVEIRIPASDLSKEARKILGVESEVVLPDMDSPEISLEELEKCIHELGKTIEEENRYIVRMLESRVEKFLSDRKMQKPRGWGSYIDYRKSRFYWNETLDGELMKNVEEEVKKREAARSGQKKK